MALKPSPKASKASKASKPTIANNEQLQSFTQDKFEKELKALASKAQEETTTKFLLSQLWVLVQSATLLSLAAIYSNVSQLTLSPVYGSYPAGIWHSKGVMTACFLGWSSNLFIGRSIPIRKPVQLLPIIAAYIPMAQYFLFKLSGYMGANIGPLITEGLTFLPLLFLSVSCTASTLDDLELTSGRWPWISDAAPGMISYAFFKTMDLLGGEWLVNGKKTKGIAEPIYGIFVMLEAIRLIEVEKPIKDEDASALVIGLGIGTTPAALISHGIHTTLKFNYIVHDVFTGGAEPVDLFTYEFLKDLHDILEPGGVIAINYAGDFLLPPFSIIHRTIRSLFSTCRVYREAEAPTDQHIAKTGQDFTNMVIFCIKPLSENPSSSLVPAIKFRNPIEKDFLKSNARRAYLLPKWEIEDEELSRGEEKGDEEFSGILRRNDTARLAEWQTKSAKGHWGVMRGVLPGGVWIDW
ncbi:hypothetical protein DID88_004170 [Monilinia fructigena]|uniref:Uncharacterized protein n=1 Tax=Monilinia fructigena TaxID=38457 RepID=A0A395ISN9_9HELO|nr:hypothetical protein DID88_004170 [Monilinia fructigena]